ncbi:hypothetical protein QWY93_07550 [Echinicola jeungdonensis]|uniref:Tetratricopeptide repeat protein n=1 Tax=Echinicola jeungdonensis TaxID=709343 RepID=A0ABV5J968_9BACT|nr:hypothetical protein [Echinicola jeungdonensis]MDN3669178.1 hypothetical protein [Echinicola jeungdonensis]
MKRKLIFWGLLIILFFSCNPKEKKTESSATPSIKICGALTVDTAWYAGDNKAPLFDGLNVLHIPITTSNPLAQQYFNQGMVLSYGFNHAEAARSFYYAGKLDPNCAMAHWGYAYVLGPNYNAGMESDNYSRAYKAVQKALEASEEASPKERAMIKALAKRYKATAPEDRTDLDLAYSEAMKKVFQEYPRDPHIGALYAESLMDMHPWDLWDKKGQPKPWTPEILDALDKVFALDPDHIGAHHFYIHAVEASKNPENAYKSARLFDDDAVPGAGHLVHMPSHVYIRTGDYHKGTLANIRAVKVDSLYVTACHAQGAYPLAYFPHNYHFMAATATLEGNSQWAIEGAQKLAEHTNTEIMKQPGWGTLQHYYTIPYYVYVKLGLWNKVLAMENEDLQLKYPSAVRHYARGMAYLGKKNLENAKMELEKLDQYAKDESLKELTIWDINSVHTLMQIATRVLEGEILASEGKYDQSIQLLKEAVEIEDQLNYNEPPDWFFSVRHHLGSVQNDAGKYDAAIKTFQEDLENLPKNGWALHGLKWAYKKSDQSEKLAEVENQLATVWSTADIQLENARVK